MLRWVIPLLALVTVGCAAPPRGAPPSEGGGSSPDPGLSTGSAAPIDGDLAGIEGLQAYGAARPDEFGGLYIDPPGGTSVVMLFTEHLDEHAAAVARIHPGTRTRGAEHTERDLVHLLESLDFEALAADGIEMVSASVDVIRNRVTVEVKSNDPTVELRLEAAHAGMLDVTTFPVPGPWSNADSGDGWRLLAAGEASHAEAYTVRAATDEDSWAELWTGSGLDVAVPEIDLGREVAVSFGHGIGSSCPELRLDGVTIDAGVVFSRTSDPLAPRGCTGDLAGTAVFVVAVERAALPDDVFTLQLAERSVTCDDCGFAERIEVELP